MDANRTERVVAGRRLPAAPKDGFEPGRQRAGAERLRQEVIGAELEHSHLVVLVPFGGEHDDGDGSGGGARAQVRQHPIAVESRQVQIEHDDVRPDAVDLVERLNPVASLRYVVAVPLDAGMPLDGRRLAGAGAASTSSSCGTSTTRISSSTVDSPRSTWASPESHSDFMPPCRAAFAIRSAGSPAAMRLSTSGVTVSTSIIENRPRYPVIAQSGQPAARYSGVPLGIHGFSRSGGASIQTSLHVGQSLRISRCATTPRNAAAILYASTPMSTRRVTAFAASLVCRVESTRCPVSDACTAICAVSRSRISPTSTTLGS